MPAPLRSFISNNIFPEESNLVFDVLKYKKGSRIMFDIGAGHGSTFLRFAKLGWKVFAFEPDKFNYEIASKNAAGLTNVELIALAVNSEDKTNVPFFRSGISDGISGLSSFDPSHIKDGFVDTTRLETFCQTHGINDIDYLKIDAEGYDFEVLKSLNWSKIKPCVIMFEFEDSRSKSMGYTLKDVVNFLSGMNYQFLISEWHPVEKRGRPHKWKNFSIAIENVNPNGWGNVIAIRDPEIFKKILNITSDPLISCKWKIGAKLMKIWWGIRFGF